MRQRSRHIPVVAALVVSAAAISGGVGCEAIVSNAVPAFTCQVGAAATCATGSYCHDSVCVACETTDDCDGVDNDCDGIVDNGPDDDKDGDHFTSCGHLSDTGQLVDPDCNDNDPAVFPGATEVCNGKDDDCDGVVDNADRVCSGGATCDPSLRQCVGGDDGGPGGDSGGDGGALPPAPSAGDLLITEVMFNPSTPEPPTEWFEVYNSASSARLLSGLSIVDGAARTHTVALTPPVTIGSKAYVVFANSRSAAIVTAKIPDGVIAYEYGTGAQISLSNDAKGAVSLQLAGATLASAPYGTWTGLGASGASVEIRTLDLATSTMAANWCTSPNIWSGGVDHGTPGAASDCP